MIAKKRHEEFARKRAMHYNMGNVLHHSENDDSDIDDEQDQKDDTSIPPIPVAPK